MSKWISFARLLRLLEALRTFLERVHLLLPIIATLLIVKGFFDIDFQWQEPHFSWELTTGLIISTTVLLAFVVPRLMLGSRRPILIKVPASESALLHRREALIARTATPNDIDTVVEYAMSALPFRLASKAPEERRRLTWHTWLSAQPSSILLFEESNGRTRRLVGYSVIARVSKAWYVRYRRGETSSWYLDTSALEFSKLDVTPYLLVQTFWCGGKHSTAVADFVAVAFLQHLLRFCPKFTSHPPCIIAPCNVRRGQQNLRALGFEAVGESEAGSALHELDLRRADELSEKAHRSFSLLKQLSRIAIYSRPVRDL